MEQTIYNLETLPTWVASDGTHVENYDGYPRWSGKAEMARGKGFENPPSIGTRVLVNFNGFGLGTVRGYFVEHGWLGLYVEVDQRPDWHIKQNPGRNQPMVFGAEVCQAPDVVLSRAAGGHKRHVRLAGHMTALCGFKPGDGKRNKVTQQRNRSSWHSFPEGTTPNGNRHGCPKCLAHPTSSTLAHFNEQRHRDMGADGDASPEAK